MRTFERLTTCGPLFALLLAAGCSARMAPPELPQRRDVITRDEMMRSGHSDLDAFQLIRTLRPQFLAPQPGIRRATAPNEIVVYIDGVRQPIGPDALRSVRASNVEEIRYLEPIAAANQLGPLAAGGAVLLKLHIARRDTIPEATR